MNQDAAGDAVRVGLAHVVGRLCEEFDGVFSRETVAAVVADRHDALGAYRVSAYVPLLAHRFARERLRATAIVKGSLM